MNYETRAMAPQLSDRLQAFFESKGFATYGSYFTLAGDPLNSDHSSGLVAMNAVASLAATEPRATNFVQALWNTPVPSGQWRYYNGMLYLLAFLHCGGEFRIWPPRLTGPNQGQYPPPPLRRQR